MTEIYMYNVYEYITYSFVLQHLTNQYAFFNFHDPYYYVSGWGNSTSYILKQELQKYESNNVIRLLLNL